MDILSLPLTIFGLISFAIWYPLAFSYNKIWHSRKNDNNPPGGITLPFKIKDDKITGVITVGTTDDKMKQQMFEVAINTMVGTTWLYSVDICENQDCSGKSFRAFDGRLSKTHVRKDTKPFYQEYGVNTNLNGFIGEDTVSIGGLIVENVEFGEINSITGNVDGIDGVLGLGLMSTSTYHEALVLKLLQQKKVEPVFGIYINPTRNAAERGKVVFGDSGKEFTISKFIIHEVIKNNKNEFTGWRITLDKAIMQRPGDIQVPIGLVKHEAIPAPMQEEISLPFYDDVINNIFSRAEFPHEGRSFPCHSKWRKLPDLIFIIDKTKYVLKPEDYVISVNPKQGATNCMVAISPSGSDLRVLLGRTFMKKYYTRFNIEKKEVQFAEVAQFNSFTYKLLHYLS